MEQVIGSGAEGYDIVEVKKDIIPESKIEENSVKVEKEYPYIEIVNISKPKYIFKRLKDMMGIEGTVRQDISMYLHKGGKTYKIGNIAGVQVTSVIEMFGIDGIVGYLDKNTKLEGKNIYILAY